jgi:hypothetical protein
MAELPERLKKDVAEARNRVKETRVNLTGGVVEKRAEESGKSVADLGKEAYDTLDETFSKITNELSTGAYLLGEQSVHEIDKITNSIKNLHEQVRKQRREITGGYIEDKTKETLKLVEKKLNKLIDEIK